MKDFENAIPLFLLAGSPGCWACKPSGRNGKAYKTPRPAAKRCWDSPDLQGCSIYLLFGSVLGPLVMPFGGHQTSSRYYAIHAARGADAVGMQAGNGFVVLKGSMAAGSVTPSCPKSTQRRREKLRAQGIIDETWKFTEDQYFPSFSAAAATVMGRSANGLTEWRKI